MISYNCSIGPKIHLWRAKSNVAQLSCIPGSATNFTRSLQEHFFG